MKNIFKIISTLIIAVVMLATNVSGTQKQNLTAQSNTASESATVSEGVSSNESTVSKAKEQKEEQNSSSKSTASATSSKAPKSAKAESKKTSSKAQSPKANGSIATTEPEIERPLKEMEEKIIALVNEEREKAGVAPLKTANIFYGETLLRATECTECWSHTRPNGKKWTSVYTDLSNYKVRTIGENLGKNFMEPETIMQALMASEGHRNNILNPNYTHLCVAVCLMPKDEYPNHTLYAVTQHFYKMEELI